MALFNWSSTYSVKITEIDNQHKVLIQLINDLHDAMKAGKGKDVLGKIIDELVKYTNFHFGFEEKLLNKYGYPDEKNHKAVHVKLVEQVVEIKEKYSKGELVLSLDVMSFLKGWLANHIMGTDKKYVDHLTSKGLN